MMQGARRWVIATATVVAFAGPAATAAGAQDLTCGTLITEDTTLTHDLVDCPDDGLVVAQDGVTVDLGGHTIKGLDAGIGVDVGRRSGVVVRNGSIGRFEVGVQLDFRGSASLQDVTVARNGSGVTAFDSGAITLTESLVVGNRNDGVAAIASGPITLTRSRVLRNGGAGYSGHGAEPALLQDNLFEANGTDGVSIVNATTRLVGNTARDNGRHGLHVADNYGIFFPYWFQANRADHNGELGIAFETTVPAGTDGGGNAAKHNGDDRQCLNVVCARNRGLARLKSSPATVTAAHHE